MKEFAKEIYFIRYKKHYLRKVFQFLNLKLSTHNMFNSPGYWTLNNDDLKKIGLYFDENKKDFKREFLMKYHLIYHAVPIEIVNDTLKRVDDYLANETLFFEGLNKWIDHTIDEVYIERNMEVHSNLINDLSAVKLKEDFLRISRTLYFGITEYCDNRNPNNLELVMNRILTRKRNL